MKKFLFSIIISLGLLSIKRQHNYIPSPSLDKVYDMPVIRNHRLAKFNTSDDYPVEQRDESVRKWLAAEVKIYNLQGASGSGTIIYYDEKENWAYIQSCGHLWNGSMSAQSRKDVNCKIEVWYHNDTKLPETKKYPAEVIFYSNVRGYDCSLLRFQPDWKPDYFPIAPEDYALEPNKQYHSVGCDGGREVAHYEVTFINYDELDAVTRRNSPRPGRSGGGLLSDDGYYIGICWGTSDTSGRGVGLFTPLKTIRALNTKNGYEWLNEVGNSKARKLPIVDRNNPQKKYVKEYIPLPGRN